VETPSFLMDNNAKRRFDMINEKFFASSLGKQIRYARMKKGLSLEQLGEQTSMSPNFIGRIERGTSLPKSFTLYKLCKELGINPSFLFIQAEKEYKEQI
jgi:transcriptional regulator with XRE-family HTH domain